MNETPKVFENKIFNWDAEYAGVKSKGVFCADYTVLEISGEILTPKFQVLDTIDLKIKPDNGKYIINTGAMAANKIDLQKHDAVAITEGQAKNQFYNFLKKNSDDGRIKLITAGQNVSGDNRYLQENKFISPASFEKFCSYQFIDSGVIATFLKTFGFMPQTKKGTGEYSNSLEALGLFFNIPIKDLHTARGDKNLFREVLRHFVMKTNFQP